MSNVRKTSLLTFNNYQFFYSIQIYITWREKIKLRNFNNEYLIRLHNNYIFKLFLKEVQFNAILTGADTGFKVYFGTKTPDLGT